MSVPGNSEQKENNFENLQQVLIHSNAGNTHQPLATLTLDELFEFLEKNFVAYHNIANLKAVLPFIHLCLRLYARRDYSKYDIGMILFTFYEEHKEDEKDLMIVVQIIHQVLHSLIMYDNKEIEISRKVFAQLIKQLPTIKDRKLVSNMIVCLQVYMQSYGDSNDLMKILWLDLSQQLNTDSVSKNTHVDILMQLFDEFNRIIPNIFCDATVVGTIQFLLKSLEREYRKCGYYLFKKTIHSFIANSKNSSNFWFSPEYAQQMERSWISYITILENLEENQSHLIMPSLKNLNELIAGKQLQSSWMDILFMRILIHKNNLVLRWSIEYFLDAFTCSDLNRDIVKQLLEASNSNILYNYEGYFISDKHFTHFLHGDLSTLYDVLGEINWKSVPLYHWLTLLNKRDTPKSVTYEQVLKIASRVRALQDCFIRKLAVYVMNNLFLKIVENMTMEEYVTYIEALCNSADAVNVYVHIYKKKPTLLQKKKENVFNGRIYEILVANIDTTTPEEFTDFLKDIPVEKHGWLKLLPFHFDFENIQQLDFTRLYGINIIDCITSSLVQIFEHFDHHLCFDPTDKNESEQRRSSAIAFYLHNIETLDNETDENFKMIFNSKLTDKSIRKLCSGLKETKKPFAKWIIDNLIELVSNVKANYEEYSNLYTYLRKNDLLQDFIEKMISKCPKYLMECDINILKYLNRTDFFCDNIKKGDSRIEESYCAKLFNTKTLDYYVRYLWIKQVKFFADKEYLGHLINCHKAITKKKPRYFANSYEHRIKMRIALGLSHTLLAVEISENLLDELWNILLHENNQLNISYFYEYIIGTKDKRTDVFLKKLNEAHALTSSQQVSIMSATYTFCMRQMDLLNAEARRDVVKNLLALTMGANFHTRLFAQKTLFQLLSTNEFEKNITTTKLILETIKVATPGNLVEHLNDLRLVMHKFVFTDIAWEFILYVTNVPYDEVLDVVNIHNFSTEMKDQLTKCRLVFTKKMDTTNIEIMEFEVNDQLQRKMNPSSDVLVPNNLMIYPETDKCNEMFVIASLIDKLPNLGGIARTCEVLGIRNLVMDSKKDIEKKDFKNLSMTAEKSLNIIEVKPRDLRDFIISKQKEGFAVVGAEQTSNSESFVNFQFPRKCILLLGHEKDGIPPTLLGLLDYAVEIPQFGQVRSLNVHVTGALFMWEYCKQHMV